MNLRIKAFGLVEILVAIAIFGTAIVSATAFTIKSLQVIKDNELRDRSTAVMVRTLEYLKSDAVTDDDLGTINGSAVKYFRVETESNSDTMKFTEVINGSLLDEAACSSTSSQYYWATSPDPNDSFLFCQQVIVVGTAGNNYQVTSRVVYKLGAKYETSELKGFKIK